MQIKKLFVTFWINYLKNKTNKKNIHQHWLLHNELSPVTLWIGEGVLLLLQLFLDGIENCKTEFCLPFWLISPSLPNKRAPKQLRKIRVLSENNAECRDVVVLLLFGFWFTLSRTIEPQDWALYKRPRWNIPGMHSFLWT